MKTYEEAIIFAVEIIRKEGNGVRFGAYSMIADIYGKEYSDIYADGDALNKAYEAEQKRKAKKAAQTANEARRAANVASGKHPPREPKQRRMDLGV